MVASPLIQNDAIVQALHSFDVPFLRAVQETTVPTLTFEDLTIALAEHTEARFNHTLIPLFLRHPALASRHATQFAQLPLATASTLRHYYTAAVYLQKLWAVQLNLLLDNFQELPNYFGEAHYGLVPVDQHHGEKGLRQLAAQQEKYNQQSVYEDTLHVFLDQLWAQRND